MTAAQPENLPLLNIFTAPSDTFPDSSKPAPNANPVYGKFREKLFSNLTAPAPILNVQSEFEKANLAIIGFIKSIAERELGTSAS
mgnify:CR=1 FL=1